MENEGDRNVDESFKDELNEEAQEIITEPSSKQPKLDEGSSSVKDSGESNSLLCKLSSHDFAELKKTLTFVDKTLFIKTVLNDSCDVVLLTAPRAFGKSTLMNMLKQFLLGKTSLFKDLKISKDERFFSRHCRRHPVIHIDLVDVRGNNFAGVKRQLALAINCAFLQHEYLVKRTDGGTLTWASEKLKNAVEINIKSFEKLFDKEICLTLSETELIDSIVFLSEVLHTHYGEKVYILIDEYDAPAVGMMVETFSNKDDIDFIHSLLNSFMANTLKSNDHLGRSLIFACVRLAGALSGNAARVITHYPFLSDIRYASYLGFTSKEVEQLLQVPEVKATCGELIFTTIEEWYDGYIVPGDDTLKIFSSFSVLNLLHKSFTTGTHNYISYWTDTGCIKNMKQLFVEPSIREKIEKITSGEAIKISTVKSICVEHIKRLKALMSLQLDVKPKQTVDLFLQFLAERGYFTVLPVEATYKCETEKNKDGTVKEYPTDSTQCILKIPNFEIKQHLQLLCYSEEVV